VWSSASDRGGLSGSRHKTTNERLTDTVVRSLKRHARTTQPANRALRNAQQQRQVALPAQLDRCQALENRVNL